MVVATVNPKNIYDKQDSKHVHINIEIYFSWPDFSHSAPCKNKHATISTLSVVLRFIYLLTDVWDQSIRDKTMVSRNVNGLLR